MTCAHSIFVMVFMAIFNGVIPVIGASITANILNALSDSLSGSVVPDLTIGEQLAAMMETDAGKTIIFWLVVQLIFPTRTGVECWMLVP